MEKQFDKEGLSLGAMNELGMSNMSNIHSSTNITVTSPKVLLLYTSLYLPCLAVIENTNRTVIDNVLNRTDIYTINLIKN
jgi:hypothetical protein